MAGRSDSERTFEAQRYLRALHFDAAAPEIPLINPDGIYGAETRDAVREFQRTHGLPVTGEIDYQTWTALYAAFLESRERTTRPSPVFHFPEEPGYETTPGENSDIVAIIQFILRTLAHEYDDISGSPPSGVYDEGTMKDVRCFQNTHGIPDTGRVDRNTWNSLAAAFNRMGMLRG